MGRGAQASFASIAIAACFFGSSSLHADTLPALAGGSGGCAVAGVRLSVIDAGATAIVEISAHLASMSKDATQRATCSVDWSLVMLSAPEGAASTPTIAIADSFVDHQRVLPVAFADGAGTATPHGFRGEVGAAGVTVALRLYVEGVDGGLTVELPRAALPKSTTEDAKLERRGKSARAVTAKFGVAGALALKAAPPGLSGGVGPTMPLSASTISLEIVPNGTPIEETIPPSLASLEALRGGLPQRLLDLSPQAADGFEAVARRAYAASLHADPIVAILGERILEWMAAGLPAQLPTKAIALPKSVAQAMGDVPLRLHRKLGEGGLLSPIGRPAVLRRLLAANPSAEVARAKAAKDAVAKLDASSVADVAGELVPAILEIGAPVDPPISMLLAPDDPPSMPSARAAAPTPTHRKNKLHSHQRASASMTMALLHGRLTRGFLILFALLAVAAVAIFGARERVGSARG